MEEISMAVGVLMPKIGITVESCVITEWKKKPGDAVEAGDILFSYETDKAALDCESTATGTLLEIFYGNGEEVPVLVNVCAIGSPGDDVSALRHAPEGNGEVTPLPAKPTRQEERVLAVESAEPGE
jgi:pyruvate/2-oxoglutarate dehydrogenase complex dihydrolipoamide acyltransferase (E2) component